MKKKYILTGAAGILLILLLFSGFFVLGNRINRLSADLAARDEAYRSERDQNAQTMDLLKQNLLLLRQDNTGFREFFKLPPREYPPLENLVEDSEESESSEIYFFAVGAIAERQKKELQMVEFDDFLISKDLEFLLKSRELSLRRQDGNLSVQIVGPDGLAYTIFSIDTGKRKVVSVTGNSQEFSETEDLAVFFDLQAPEVKVFYKELKNHSGNLKSIHENEVLQSIILEKKMIWGPFQENDNRIFRTLKDQSGREIVTCGYSKVGKEWFTGIQTADNFNQMVLLVREQVIAFDTRDPGDIAAEISLTEILELNEDPGFRAYLDNMGITMSGGTREDDYYFYVDLKDNNDKRVGSFGIQKHVGEIYLMDQDDVVITSLKTLGLIREIPVKKKITPPVDFSNSPPLAPGEKDITFLLIGANESNTDTMMVVHFNEESGRGTIITVPRDLYYKGRKINSIYPSYGPGELMKTLSEITGLPIKRFIYIDMFAFADVVDLLGGITITLPEPLIDPTYRIKENGKWSTLHYDAGEVHLGGIESLRVARSRHTSSDFGRAERQIMLLMAMKDKILEMNASDAGKIMDMIQILMSYVKTDFSVLEILTIFTRYRSAPFTQRVLSWDNVLYNTYTNTYRLDENIELPEDYDRGAWILLPLNNDWDLIRWFVREAVREGL